MMKTVQWRTAFWELTYVTRLYYFSYITTSKQETHRLWNHNGETWDRIAEPLLHKSSFHLVQITDFLELLRDYSKEKSENFTKF